MDSLAGFVQITERCGPLNKVIRTSEVHNVEQGSHTHANLTLTYNMLRSAYFLEKAKRFCTTLDIDLFDHI